MMRVNSSEIHFTHTRSVVKAISWRVIATLTTMVAVYIVSGEFVLALEVGAIEASAKLFLYYAHERAWIAIPWGVKKTGNNVAQ